MIQTTLRSKTGMGGLRPTFDAAAIKSGGGMGLARQKERLEALMGGWVVLADEHLCMDLDGGPAPGRERSETTMHASSRLIRVHHVKLHVWGQVGLGLQVSSADGLPTGRTQEYQPGVGSASKGVRGASMHFCVGDRLARQHRETVEGR